jgi:hypothetical protein
MPAKLRSTPRIAVARFRVSLQTLSQLENIILKIRIGIYLLSLLIGTLKLPMTHSDCYKITLRNDYKVLSKVSTP